MVGGIDIIKQGVKGDRGWEGAIRQRNKRNFCKIECLEFSTGYFAVAAEEGHRLVRAECFDAAALNFWGRPIEGVIAFVDINNRRVMQLVDTGVVPIPKAPGDYSKKAISKARAPINPIVVQQPNGPAFKVNGSPACSNEGPTESHGGTSISSPGKRRACPRGNWYFVG